ncbi:hypothetical protein MHM84_01115 [Halomonas sp. McH1-25]|uniref:hypothetical protein n=1 Tax=unclassified Halomonas TaxID=2609666 RepID=UPI001EF6D390|nr:MULTISPECIES: hypothetical protein [unclassified Halomonas]MCG7598381.1 hypothetical protein [Halomonas sp. McH1-25]MCP1342677.1 hypothetical protein [Halomonas sp. FL8]MCP1362555.1 hypothetical protein [Halomonas sp. BBD45]MCP1363721.1 hypothetical protein [Halomonas sp. BBD48]
MPLTSRDAEQLLEQLYATAEVLGSEIKPAAANLMIRDMRSYNRPEIEQALARCRAELTGRLTLAAILERMPSANAYLSPNEAWALALTSLDENETVVWTREVAIAMGTARPVLEQGDKVGARMAFIGAYEREVAATKAEGHQPTWEVSLGHDPVRRQETVQKAVTDGLLEAPKVQHLLPAPEAPDTPGCREQRRQIVAHLRQVIDGQDEAAKERRRQQQQATEQRREELLEQAERLQRGAA